MTREPAIPESESRRSSFVTTRWTMVLSAGRKSSPEAERALEDLCRTYWYPLYAYVRRQGRSKEDAEDLVQGFFERFLQRNYLERLDAGQGKFRAFLLASLKHFLANERDKAGRQKRGGGAQHFSLDWQNADERFSLEPADHLSPEVAFDREWALALLGQVIARLREECTGEGKDRLFEQCKGFLMGGEPAISYAGAAAALGVDEGAVRVAVHRLRKRFRALLRDEIAQTLADPTLVAEELSSLQAVLAG